MSTEPIIISALPWAMVVVVVVVVVQTVGGVVGIVMWQHGGGGGSGCGGRFWCCLFVQGVVAPVSWSFILCHPSVICDSLSFISHCCSSFVGSVCFAICCAGDVAVAVVVEAVGGGNSW
jgi:hypothetical protein